MWKKRDIYVLTTSAYWLGTIKKLIIYATISELQFKLRKVMWLNSKIFYIIER